MAESRNQLQREKSIDTLDRPITVRDFLSFQQQLILKITQVLKGELPTGTSSRWAKTHQICKLLDCCAGKVYSLRSAGLLPAKKIGGTIYYDVIRLQKLLTDSSFLGSVHRKEATK